MLSLILLGPPGAGKGTQAVKIKERFGIPHISTGEIFRQNIKSGTALGLKAQEYMNKGQLVPDELVIQIALDRLEKQDCRNGFLLDGFPRTIEQAKALDAYLASRGGISRVLNVEVAEGELLRRLSGRRVCKACGATYHAADMPPRKEGVCDACGGEVVQRADDAEETVRNRIKVYETQTKPLIDYYEKAGNLVHIDGAAGLDSVFSAMVKAIEG